MIAAAVAFLAFLFALAHAWSAVILWRAGLPHSAERDAVLGAIFFAIGFILWSI